MVDYEKLGAFYLGREYDLARGERKPELLRELADVEARWAEACAADIDPLRSTSFLKRL